MALTAPRGVCTSCWSETHLHRLSSRGTCTRCTTGSKPDARDRCWSIEGGHQCAKMSWRGLLVCHYHWIRGLIRFGVPSDHLTHLLQPTGCAESFTIVVPRA